MTAHSKAPIRRIAPDASAAPPHGFHVAEVEPGLRDYVAELLHSRWLLAAALVIGALVGAFRAFTAVPLYRSDALVQVERTTRGMSTLVEVSPETAFDVPSETEIEIIRSRSLLGSVVDELGLQVVAQPRWFPVVGRAVARRRAGPPPPPAPAAALLGLSRYAWGGERIEVRRLELPASLEGTLFRLTALDGGAFQLDAPSGETLLTGRIGQAATATLGSSEDEQAQTLEIFVAALRARPGTEFLVAKLPRMAVVRHLQATLQIAERGQRTGVLQIALADPDPRRATATVNAIATTYLRQNVERKSEETQKTLEFLNTQLPILRTNVEMAESALKEYRATRGQLDLSLESSATLEKSVEIERRIQELEFERAELSQRFTDQHPSLVMLREKLARLREERASIEAKIKTLPGTELQLARLTRDLQVANQLYVLLLNRAQELKVVKSGTIGNVRVLDAALPAVPVGTPGSSHVALGAVLGLLAGAGLVVARRAFRAFRGGVEDPDVIERMAGVPVYSIVAYSARQAELVRDFRRGRSHFIPPLVVAEPDGMVVEGLRSLRTSLQFTLTEARNNVISITGPSPKVGKSFLSLNLAFVLADSGARVLLVDADLRNGRLHHSFGVPRSPGLSEVIAGTAGLESSLRSNAQLPVQLLATGHLPPNPVEVLSSIRFQEFVDGLSKRYDFVVIDTPPVLAVTDAAIVGRVCGVNLLVLRAGKHPPREIVVTLKTLAHGGVTPNGAILNAADRSGPSGHRYHYQYQYPRS